jgi:AraC-like DNA-binding protein/quercetin dioxygenase-like cupin family protein
MTKPIDMQTNMMDNLTMKTPTITATQRLEKLLQVHSIGHFAQQPDHRASRKTASDHLLIWVLGGKGFGKTQGSRVEVTSGQLLSFTPGNSHAYGSDADNPWEIMWVHFGGKLAGHYVRAIREFGNPVTFLGLDTVIRDQFDDLMATSMSLKHVHYDVPENQDILTGQMLAALLGRIIHRLGGNAQSNPSLQQDQLEITKLRRYIHHHLTLPMTLESLADQNHLSVTHFSRLFREHFGTSPMHYIIQQRMARAATLLSETSSPIKQIGNAVGYEDAYYFSRLFKRITGMTPSDYRQKNRQ